MPDPLPSSFFPDSLQLRISQLFALRPTLGALGITQAQLNEDTESVLEYYAEQLIDFFCGPDTESGNRWRQLSQMLAQRLRKVLQKQVDPITRSMLQTLLTYPDSGERTPALEAYGIRRHNVLALAIVGAEKALVYTVGHGLETVDSTTQAQVLENAERLEHDVFEGWALCALEAVLQRIDAIDFSDALRLEDLDRQLAWATRCNDFFQQGPEQETLRQQLPLWLKEGSPAGRLAYSKLLVAMAGAHRKYCAKSLLDDLPEDDIAHQACFARDLALQLRRVALEYSLQGLAGVTLDGYYRLRAAVKTYATHRHVQGEPMGFRRLMDESGYLIGAQNDEAGPWLAFRPWSAQVFQQVVTPPASGPVLVEPFAELFRDRQALADSHFNAQIAPDLELDWRTDIGQRRTVALLLVSPDTPPVLEPATEHLRFKRLDAEWAGAGKALSVVQQHRLGALKRPLRVGTLIREGAHRGLHILNRVLILNKDENHFNVLSNNHINTVISINQPVHRLVDNPERPVNVGPYIAANPEDVWEIQRAPRFKRDVEGLSVRGHKSFGAAQALLARVNSASEQPAQPTTPPVEVEEQFERHARALNDAAIHLLHFTQRRNTPASAALITHLQARAEQLRSEGRRRRIDLVRSSQTPTVGDVEYLLGEHAIRIRRLNGRVLESIDGAVDYLQEFEVLDLIEGNRPLWYAHFHYPTLQTAEDQPSKAHLKLAAQRRMGRVFEQAEKDAGRSTRVYRGPIGTPVGRRIFQEVV